MKKRLLLLSLTLLLMLFLCACGSSSSSSAPVSTPVPSTDPTPITLDEYLQYLREALVDKKEILSYSVRESNDVVIVDCSGDAVDNIFSAVQNDYFANVANWDTVINVAIDMSSTIKRESQSKGLELSVVFNIVNSADADMIYCSAQDGKETFDIVDALPESQIVFHEPSMYKVGADLDAGEYYVIPTNKDDKVYVCVTSDGNGDDIIDNSFQAGPHYITVVDGQYLTVEHGRFAPASEFPAHPKEIVSDGMYLVGKDIVAGEYKLTVNESGRHGYWCLYSTSSADRDIVNNSLFDSAAYVTVSDGQYLLVSSCSGALVK